MPQNYSGNVTGLSGRPTVTISEPIGTDIRNSQSIRTPVEKLADLLQYVMGKFAFIDAINVFSATQQIGTGDLELTNAAAQSVLKATGGKLSIGTKAGNASDVEIVVNGVVKAIVRASDGKLQGQSTAAGDIGATLVTKDFIDAFASPTRTALPLTAAAIAGTGHYAPRYWKGPDGMVHLIGQFTTTGAGSPSRAQLPVGFRPADSRRLPAVAGWAADIIQIDYLGQITTPNISGTSVLVDLSGVSLLAEQ